MNILIKQKRGIGDFVFALFFTQSVKMKFPFAEIYYDVLEEYSELLDYFKCKKNIKVNYDLIIDLNRNIKTKNFLLHEVERYFLTHKYLNLDIKEAKILPRKRSVDEKKILLAIGARIPTRRWTCDNYIQLVKYLESNNFEVVLVGGKDAIEEAKEIEKVTKADNKVGKLSLVGTCKQIETAEFVIANDSGIAHLASAIGTPVFVMTFNKVQNNFRWAPWTTDAYIIRGDHNCSLVCYSSECKEVFCREALDFEYVKSEFNKFLSGKRNSLNKTEIAKNSLFFLFDNQDELYDSLQANGYKVFFYNKKDNLKEFIIKNNVNVLVNTKINFLFVKLIYISNFVSEFPLLIKTKKTKSLDFLSEIINKYAK